MIAELIPGVPILIDCKNIEVKSVNSLHRIHTILLTFRFQSKINMTAVSKRMRKSAKVHRYRTDPG